MLRSLSSLTRTLPTARANLLHPILTPPQPLSLARSLKHTMSAPAAQHPPTAPSPIQAKSFRLALVQLGGVGHDKAANLEQARAKIAEAAKGDGKGKVDLVVLPVSRSEGESTRVISDQGADADA